MHDAALKVDASPDPPLICAVHDAAPDVDASPRPTCSRKYNNPIWTTLKGRRLCCLIFQKHREQMIAKYPMAIPTNTYTYVSVRWLSAHDETVAPESHKEGFNVWKTCWSSAK